jgi:RNA polymerase sigma factor (sigma-70 family)
MAHVQSQQVERQLCRMLDQTQDDPSTDRQLLERFLQQRDEEAFAILIRRHGSLVMGVCRSLLRDAHEAEDVYQATWLVLARKLRSVTWRDSIAGWLHEVAHRLALKARAQSARRDARSRSLDEEPFAPEPASDEARWLHEEVARLPEKYRAPLVLCYLEGKTSAEAARALNKPPGSMSKLLARGLDLLRDRLRGRGHGMSQAALGPALAALGQVPVPAGWAESITPAAVALAGGKVALTALASGSVVSLVRGVVSDMTLQQFKFVGVAALILLLGGAGLSILSLRSASAQPAPLERPTKLPDEKGGVQPGENKLPPTPARQLTSNQMWTAYQIVDGQTHPRKLGMTGPNLFGNPIPRGAIGAIGGPIKPPAPQVVQIPANAVWYIQPHGFGFGFGGNLGFPGPGGPGALPGGLPAPPGGGVGLLGAVGAAGGAPGVPMPPPAIPGGVGALGAVGGQQIGAAGAIGNPGQQLGAIGVGGAIGQGGAVGFGGAIGQQGAIGAAGAIGNPGQQVGMFGAIGFNGNLGQAVIGGFPGPGGGLPGMPGFAGAKLTGKDLQVLLAEMKKQQVPGLRVEHMELSDDDLALVVKELPNLRVLLLFNTKTSDAAIKHLGNLKHLHVLGLEGSEFTDKAIEEVAKLGLPLDTLRIGGSKVTNKGLSAIGDLKALRTLRITWTGIDKTGLAALAKLDTLEALEIVGESTDDDLAALKNTTGLKAVRLHYSKIGEKGVAALAKLEKLEQVTLDWMWGEDGPQFFGFGGIGFGGGIGGGGIGAGFGAVGGPAPGGLAPGGPAPGGPAPGGPPGGGAGARGALGGGPGAGALGGGPPGGFGVGGGALGVLGGPGGPGNPLGGLQIQMASSPVAILPDGTNKEKPKPTLTAANLKGLADLKGLTSLSLMGDGFGNAEAEPLKACTALKKLELFAPELTDAGLASLKDLKALERLNLCFSKITPASTPTLRALPKLRTLYVPVLPTDPTSKRTLAAFQAQLPAVAVHSLTSMPGYEMFAGLLSP